MGSGDKQVDTSEQRSVQPSKKKGIFRPTSTFDATPPLSGVIEGGDNIARALTTLDWSNPEHNASTNEEKLPAFGYKDGDKAGLLKRRYWNDIKAELEGSLEVEQNDPDTTTPKDDIQALDLAQRLVSWRLDKSEGKRKLALKAFNDYKASENPVYKKAIDIITRYTNFQLEKQREYEDKAQIDSKNEASSQQRRKSLSDWAGPRSSEDASW